MNISEIDWSSFDGYSELTCYCRCVDGIGFVFRSHVKLVIVADSLKQITRKPCPNCESHSNLRKSESDPESWSIKR